MSFVNPIFFWAMFAIAIPIIIHLINFRRHKTLYFSNTSFLQDIKKETQTRTKLKQILILLARIFAISMLVVAFAGPFLPSNNSDAQSKTHINIIYIDNSFSMENEGKSGVVFEQARQIAKQIVFNSGAGKEFILITNDMFPEHQFVLDRDKFIQEVDKIEISPSLKSLDELVLKANTILPKDSKANLYIISDMQESIFNNALVKPNPQINTVFIPTETSKSNNIFVDSCWFVSPVHRLGQDEELIVKIVNYSEEDFADIPVHLFINDTLKALSSCSIEAGQTEELSIKYVNTASGIYRARVEISDYPVTYDNVLYFNYCADNLTNVLLIQAKNNDKYLRSVFVSDPQNFIIDEVSLGKEQSAQFGNYDIIFLNGISEISSGLIAELQSYISGGGTVTLIPSKSLNVQSINAFLTSFSAGKFNESISTSQKISFIDYENAILKEVFAENSKNTDFPVVGFAHNFKLFSNSAFASLIALENGNPLLIKGNYKKGNLFVFTAPIDETNNSLFKSPVFAPVFYNLAINSQILGSLYAIFGQDAAVDVSYPYEIAASDVFRITDHLNTDAIAKVNPVGKNLKVFIPEAIINAANFDLFRADAFISVISVNYNRSESVLKYLDNQKLSQFIDDVYMGKATIIQTDDQDIAVELRELSDGKPLWQWFILLALFFVICEIAFIRLLK